MQAELSAVHQLQTLPYSPERVGLQAVWQIGRALGVTVHDHPPRLSKKQRVSHENWIDWVTQVARECGLRAARIEQTLNSAAASAEVQGPLLAFSPSLGQWIILAGATRNKFRVLLVHELERELLIERGDLAESLGLATPDAQSTFVALEPELPLERLKSGDATLSPSARVLRLLLEERHDIYVVLVYAAATGLLSLSVPLAVQVLVNTVAFGTLVQPLIVLTVLLFAALAVEGFIRVLQASVVEAMQQRVFAKTAVDMAERLATVQSDTLREKYAPELANRFFDVLTLQKAAATLLLEGAGLALQTLLGMILLAFYHPVLLAFDALLLVMIGLILWVVGSGAIPTAVKESKAKYAVLSWLEDIARNLTAFRSASSKGYAIERIHAVVTEYTNARRKHWAILVRQLIGTRLLYAVASAVLLGVGGFLVISRQMTLGQLVASELVLTAVLTGISKFTKHLESYYDLAAAVDKLGYVIDLPREEGIGQCPPQDRQGIGLELSNVALATNESDRHIALAVAPGERVALLGANSELKSRVLEMLFGLEMPKSGLALVDGVDLRRLDLTEYRSQIAFVRGPELFEGSIVENLLVGREELPISTVEDVLSRLELLPELMNTTEGLDRRVLSGGMGLTQSQSMRLTLSRALLGKPRLLLIDGGLQSIEGTARDRVLSELFRKDAPWTLVISTEASDLVDRCDRSVRIEPRSNIESAPDDAGLGMAVAGPNASQSLQTEKLSAEGSP